MVKSICILAGKKECSFAVVNTDPQIRRSLLKCLVVKSSR